MGNFAKIIPFVWPYRRQLVISVVVAGFVALLWGANLSFTFPLVKVLLEGQSLHKYVDDEIAATEEKIESGTKFIDSLDETNLESRARHQRKLSDASQRLQLLQWGRQWILPWVPTDRFDTFAVILGMLLTATVFKCAAIYLQDVLVGGVVELTVLGIRKECFRRSLKLDVQTLASGGTAELMSRFTNDVTLLSQGLQLLGGKVIREPLKAIACIAFAFVVNWRLTLITLLFVPLLGLAFHRFGKLIKKAAHGTMDSMARIHKVLGETFGAIRVVLAFGGERKQRHRFHVENKRYFQKSMKVVRLGALTSPTTEVLGMLAVFVALLPGAYLVLRGQQKIWGIQLSSDVMDIADLSVLYALLAGTLDPVRKMSSLYSRLKHSSAAIERIFELMERETQIHEPEQPRILDRHSKSIEFNNVTFWYSLEQEQAHRPPALNEFNLSIAAGEVVAVVGQNGSGKSTLLNLLPRFFDAKRGSVLIDGVDIRNVRLRDLRRQIGLVTQETKLFDDTIFENIRYGHFDATETQVEAAASQAHVSAFVGQLPEGIHTTVGEDGRCLSGGQRQRVALARAILRDPSILILDEATSAIDSQSEQLIHRALKTFVKGRTTFIITHAINDTLLELVTQIVVLDQGRLAAAGTHAELIESCTQYRRLYQSQVSKRAG